VILRIFISLKDGVMTYRALCSMAFFLAPLSLSATVGSVTSGQSLWWIDKRIAATYDSIETKIDALDVCGGDVLDTADIAITGTIILSTSGNYCVATDLATGILINTTGVALNLNGHSITGVIEVTGTTSNVVIENGLLTPAAPSSAPQAALVIGTNASAVRIQDLQITCTDSDAGIAGRTGVQISGNDIQITRCTVIAGAGGNTSGVAAPDGGDGIEVTSAATNTVIKNCVLLSGNGADTNGAGNAGGVGGFGIHINNAVHAEIISSTIFRVGLGGSGDPAGESGDGIRIESSSDAVSVHDCIIRNAGTGGISAGDGVVDVVSTTSSVIFRNIAYDIDGTNFSLVNSGSEDGVDLVVHDFSPTATINNYMVNVFMQE
jgi:hypothetical protein